MQIRFKRLHPDAVAPTKAHPNDAGFDLAAPSQVTIPADSRLLIATGIAVEIPPGFCGLVTGRSGNTIRRGLVGQLGIIDCGYHGDIGVMAFNTTAEPITLVRGERIGQLVIVPIPDATLVEDGNFETADRLGGFGSTGK